MRKIIESFLQPFLTAAFYCISYPWFDNNLFNGCICKLQVYYASLLIKILFYENYLKIFWKSENVSVYFGNVMWAYTFCFIWEVCITGCPRSTFLTEIIKFFDEFEHLNRIRNLQIQRFSYMSTWNQWLQINNGNCCLCYQITSTKLQELNIEYLSDKINIWITCLEWESNLQPKGF